MPVFLLTSRFTNDAQALWRVAGREGWRVERVRGIDVPADLDPREPVAIYIEPLVAPALAEAVGVTLLEPANDWLAGLPDDLLRRTVRAGTLGQARRLDAPAFVKPPNDKSFAARVYPDGLALPEGDDASPVLIAEPVRWRSEFRAFCLDGKVLTVSPYLRDGRLAQQDGYAATDDELRQAWAVCERVLDRGDLPRAIVVDVGEIDGRGWAVVEANPAWSSGLYACDPREAFRCVAAACERGSSPAGVGRTRVEGA